MVCKAGKNNWQEEWSKPLICPLGGCSYKGVTSCENYEKAIM